MRKRKRSRTVLALIIVMLLLTASAAAFLIWHSSVGKEAGKTEAAVQPPAEQVQAEPAPVPEKPEERQEPEVRRMDAQVSRIPKPQTLTLMALGDNLIHNCIYWSAELREGGYDFAPYYQDIAPLVQSYDLACINQETIYVKDAWNVSNYPKFGSPTEVGDALAEAGFDVVTCATNHCYDKGLTGLGDTISYWREKHPEITVLGIHDTPEQARTVQVVEKNGIRLALLNYTYGINDGGPADRWRVDTFSSFDQVQADLQRAEEAADLTVVFAHWGEEDAFTPDSFEKDWAQFLADNGADVIIGGHPHVLQPLEVVTAADGREVPVFYSLGNFLSHQTEMKNLLGGMASVTFMKDAGGIYVSEYELKPVVTVILRSEREYMFDYRPMLLEDYTEQIAAQHRFPDCTVGAMQFLYRQIVGPQEK